MDVSTFSGAKMKFGGALLLTVAVAAAACGADPAWRASTIPARTPLALHAWEEGGKAYLNVTNRQGAPYMARVAFTREVGVPSVVSGSLSAVWMAKREIDVRLEPFAGGVLTFGAPPVEEKLPPLPEGAFTYVVIPDTQRYSGAGMRVKDGKPPAKGPTQNKAFASRVDWIVRNIETQRIVFVSHVGDIVDVCNEPQWRFASEQVARFEGRVPFGLSVGNHDSKKGDTVASGFTRTFPASRYASYPWYAANRDDNAYSCQTFEAGGMKFVVLHLACNAPEDALCWADAMLKKHADRVGIIVTHMYLGILDRRLDKAIKNAQLMQPPGYADCFGVMNWKKVHGEKGVTPQEAWQRHFSKHKNLFLILCGDQSLATAWRHLQYGQAGNRVYSVLQDYPRRSDLEDWIRLYRFRPDRGVVEVYTYSPAQDRLCVDAGVWHGRDWHQFTLPLPGGKR